MSTQNVCFYRKLKKHPRIIIQFPSLTVLYNQLREKIVTKCQNAKIYNLLEIQENYNFWSKSTADQQPSETVKNKQPNPRTTDISGYNDEAVFPLKHLHLQLHSNNNKRNANYSPI